MKTVVIGAGIVGVSTALYLRRAGHDVVLVDRLGPGEGTSYGNAGVLASCSVVPVTGPGLLRKAPKMLFDRNEPLFVKWGYLPKLAPWLRQYLSHANEADTRRIAAGLAGLVPGSLEEHQRLAEGSPAARHIVPSDYCFGYADEARFAADGLAWSLRRAHGFSWRVMTGAAVQDYDPELSDAVGCLVAVPGHGHITDPGGYLKALAATAAGEGVSLIKGDAEAVAREGGAVSGVRISGETVPADAVVVATGVWSGPLAKDLGLRVPLESERGYHLELLEPSAMPRAPVMIAAGKFVATPMEGRVRLAGIVEFGGLKAPPSEAPFQLLERAFRAAMPGVSWGEMRRWMGHRPAPSDSLPLVGPVPGVKGAFLGFGHHHIGLTAGPKTGRLLSMMVSGARLNVDMAPFAPARFA
ncbi:MAG: FAD-dependent oxidoreductase [Pseudomonadota bacterium]